MKKLFLVLVSIFTFSSMSLANKTVFRIETGSDYKSYSDTDLKRRVWELERAVMQLQRKVFELQNDSNSHSSSGDSWVCTVEGGFGKTYSATGNSKAVATHRAMEECKNKSDDSFFCRKPKCEN